MDDVNAKEEVETELDDGAAAEDPEPELAVDEGAANSTLAADDPSTLATAKKKEAAPKKPPKEPAVNEAAIRAIVGWFLLHGKPGVPQSVMDGVGSKFSKPVVQRSLETAAARGLLRFRDVKKVRVYFPCAAAAETAALPSSADSCSVADLEAQVAALESTESQLQSELKALRSRKTIAELEQDVAHRQMQADELRRRLQSFTGTGRTRVVTAEEMDGVVQALFRARAAWRTRRALAQGLFGMAFQETPWSEAAGELGLEDDAAAAVSMQQDWDIIPLRYRRAERR